MTDSFNFIELGTGELEVINGGGGLGRIIGWVLGLPEGYVRHCRAHPDMAETLMNCI